MWYWKGKNPPWNQMWYFIPKNVAEDRNIGDMWLNWPPYYHGNHKIGFWNIWQIFSSKVSNIFCSWGRRSISAIAWYIYFFVLCRIWKIESITREFLPFEWNNFCVSVYFDWFFRLFVEDYFYLCCFLVIDCLISKVSNVWLISK